MIESYWYRRQLISIFGEIVVSMKMQFLKVSRGLIFQLAQSDAGLKPYVFFSVVVQLYATVKSGFLFFFYALVSGSFRGAKWTRKQSYC